MSSISGTGGGGKNPSPKSSIAGLFHKRGQSFNKNNHPLYLSDQTRTLPSRRNKSLEGGAATTAVQIASNETWLFSNNNEQQKIELALRQQQAFSPRTAHSQHRTPPRKLHSQQFQEQEPIVKRARVPQLALTPMGVVNQFEDDIQQFPNLMSPSGAVPGGPRLKFLPQTSVLQRKQAVIAKQSKNSPHADMTLLYSLKKQNQLKRNDIYRRKSSIDYQSLEGGVDAQKIDIASEKMNVSSIVNSNISDIADSSSFFIPRKLKRNSKLLSPSPLPKQTASVLTQGDSFVKDYPASIKSQAHKDRQKLQTIQDIEESKELPLKNEPKQIKSETMSLVNHDIHSYIQSEDSPHRRTPVHRKLSPLPTQVHARRSYDKSKPVVVVLPNGARVRVKRELRLLLKAIAQDKNKKFYSVTPEQEITYDTLLAKDTLIPIVDEIPTSDVILSQRNLLFNITRGSFSRQLRELEYRLPKNQIINGPGDDIITLGTDFDGASTDSEQPNLISPLYHKHQPRMSITGNRIHSKDGFAFFKGSGVIDHGDHLSFDRRKPKNRKKSIDITAKLMSGRISPRFDQSNTLSSNVFPGHFRTLSMYTDPAKRRGSIFMRQEPEKSMKLKNILRDREIHQQKRLEVESQLSIKLDALMKKFVNTEIRKKFNIQETQFLATLKIFKKLCLASLKQRHGFLRSDVISFGVSPQLLCQQLSIPLYLLVGINPQYKNIEGNILVTWMDFVKLMSILYFKTAGDFDTLYFILKGLCLTRPEQFTKFGLYNAIRKAVHHHNFPYPDDVASIWSIIYNKLVGIKSLYIDLTASVVQSEQTLPETPKSGTVRPKNVHIPDAGIINHQRIFRVKKKEGLIGEDTLSLDLQAAARFLVGYVDSRQLRRLIEYLLTIEV